MQSIRAAQLITIGLLICVSVVSFAIGRISATAENRDPVRITRTLPHDNQVSPARLVGSRLSDKYHFPWCSGAQRINPDNVVTFSDREGARRRGYTPAANCPGLEDK